MRIRYYFIGAALVAAAAVAQVPVPDQTPGEPAEPGPDATTIPEIPAGTDPMGRKPDPAAGSGAAVDDSRGADASTDDTTCRVERADTDTGFVVVCG